MAKRIVRHPKLYLAVAGALQHVPKGTEVTVTDEQIKRLGKKLEDPAQAKALDATAKGGKLVAAAGLSELEAKLAAAEERAEKAESALVATASKRPAVPPKK